MLRPMQGKKISKLLELNSVLKSNYSENKFSEFSNGSRTHDLPEYRLDALTTELYRENILIVSLVEATGAVAKIFARVVG